MGDDGQREQLMEIHPEVTFTTVEVDLDAYHHYLNSCGIDYPAYEDNWHEKSLEHYMSIQLMGGVQKKDVFMDVASMISPFPSFLRNSIACKVYHQDLCYPPGINEAEEQVGGDAADMPFQDHSLDKMTLHCSFEHFEQDADSRFIIEAGRVLRPGGKLCILPLYVKEHAYVLTDPAFPGWNGRAFRARTKFEQDTQIIYKVGYGNADFCRCYNAKSLSTRVFDRAKGLFKTVMYEISNVDQVHESCYMKWAVVFTKI